MIMTFHKLPHTLMSTIANVIYRHSCNNAQDLLLSMGSYRLATTKHYCGTLPLTQLHKQLPTILLEELYTIITKVHKVDNVAAAF